MNTTNNTSKLVILGLMTGILLLMAYTPLGYLNIGPLAITFNVIPVAIAAITLGPAGGAAIGAVFGMTSFLQCIGIGGSSCIVSHRKQAPNVLAANLRKAAEERNFCRNVRICIRICI